MKATLYDDKFSYHIATLKKSCMAGRNIGNICWVSLKKFARLAVCEIKNMRLIFKTKMLMYQSKANLDEKNFFVKSHVVMTQQLEKCLEGVRMGIENSTFHSGP